MNEKFYIRTVALFLLEKLYLKSKYDFTSTIDITKLLNNDIKINMLQTAAFYLKEKDFITYSTVPYQTNNWTANITAAGVDWIEECYKIDPTNYIKE